MNLRTFLVVAILATTSRASIESTNETSQVLGKETSDQGARYQDPETRQVFMGYDVQTVVDMVLRYVRNGLTYLSDKFHIAMGSNDSRNSKVTYRGYQVLRINAVDEVQVKHLRKLPDEVDGTEFWTPPADNTFTDLLVSPDSLDDVKDYLKEQNVDYEVLIRDLQKVIAFENPKMNKEQRNLLIDKRGHPFTWMRYHRYSDILKYMEYLVLTYPQQVELLTIGFTTEGLPIKVIKVSTQHPGVDHEDDPKPAFWIDGGMHGREWITSSVVLFIVRQLVENYNKHKETTDSATWYFLPVANPDGYEYSHTTDRLWKKNKSRQDSSEYNFFRQLLYGSCKGVDLNRNFDFHWGEDDSSVDPCRERYAGPRPLSEPETRAISDFIMLKKDKLKMFLTLHSYSQKWLVPWSYTTRKSYDYKDMEKMAKKAAQAIALVSGSHYDVGPSASLMYPKSGTAEDWAKGTAGVKYSYSVKLRDRGSFGFLLPAGQIIPTAKEIFVAVKVLAKMITSKNL